MSDAMTVFEDLRSYELDSPLVVGTPFACVLKLLDRLTLTQLQSLKTYGILEAQKRVTKKADAKVAAETGRPALLAEDDEVDLGGERDGGADEPTRVMRIDPTAGVKEFLNGE